MPTLSVSLSHEITSLEELVAQYPGASLHVIHLALLRIGIRAALQDSKVVDDELAGIHEERRVRRRNTRAEQRGVR